MISLPILLLMNYYLTPKHRTAHSFCLREVRAHDADGLAVGISWAGGRLAASGGEEAQSGWEEW